MPLSPENRDLIERTAPIINRALTPEGTSERALEAILNACRLEERAKAEGEVEKWKAERDIEKALSFQRLRRNEELAANLAKAEARIAEMEGALMGALASFRCTQRPECYPAGHWSNLALTALAKLKAAPLQGDGSSSVSSVESAARLASQVCDQDRSTPLEGGDL